MELVILVADKNMQFGIRGALNRPEALGTRKMSFDFRTHVGRDGGVRSTGPETLAVESRRFGHALMVLDYEGCGSSAPILQLEDELDARLSESWGDRAKAIVIAPELEAWIWGNDNLLCEILEWPLEGSIRGWLEKEGFTFNNDNKPLRPKEAFEHLIAVHKQPRSSSQYEKITARLSLSRCTDSSYQRLRAKLREWFPPL